jgi:hypothetical protein
MEEGLTRTVEDAAGRGKGPTPKSRDWPSSRLRPSPQSAAPLPLRAIAMTKGRPRETMCCLRTPSNVTRGSQHSGFAGVTGESDRQVTLRSMPHCSNGWVCISNGTASKAEACDGKERAMGRDSSAIVSLTSPLPLWHVKIWEPQMARCAVDRGGRQGTVPQ